MATAGISSSTPPPAPQRPNAADLKRMADARAEDTRAENRAEHTRAETARATQTSAERQRVQQEQAQRQAEQARQPVVNTQGQTTGRLINEQA